MPDHVLDADLVTPRFREALLDATLSPAVRMNSKAAAWPRRLALASFCIAQAQWSDVFCEARQHHNSHLTAYHADGVPASQRAVPATARYWDGRDMAGSLAAWKHIRHARLQQRRTACNAVCPLTSDDSASADCWLAPTGAGGLPMFTVSAAEGVVIARMSTARARGFAGDGESASAPMLSDTILVFTGLSNTL